MSHPATCPHVCTCGDCNARPLDPSSGANRSPCPTSPPGSLGARWRSGRAPCSSGPASWQVSHLEQLRIGLGRSPVQFLLWYVGLNQDRWHFEFYREIACIRHLKWYRQKFPGSRICRPLRTFQIYAKRNARGLLLTKDFDLEVSAVVRP